MTLFFYKRDLQHLPIAITVNLGIFFCPYTYEYSRSTVMNPNFNLENPPNRLIHVSVGVTVSIMGLRDDETPLAKEDSEQTKEENHLHKEETTKEETKGSKEETHLSKEETSNLRKKHIGPSCKLFFR